MTIDPAASGRGTRLPRRRGVGALPWLLALLMLCVAQVAAAAVRVDTPVGWRRVDDGAARRRVDAWVEGRSDVRVLEVLTTEGRDDFSEVMALLEIDGVLDRTQTSELELARVTEGLLPWTTTARVRTDDLEGLPRMQAHWDADAIAYDIALVPSGEHRTLLVQATLASETTLYQAPWATAIASMRGATEPVAAFDRASWRRRSAIAWGVGGTLLLALLLWLRPFGAGAIVVGRAVAVVFLAIAVIVGVAVHDRLGDSTTALRIAGLSRDTLSAELAAHGIFAAVAAWLVGQLWGRGEGVIASAPVLGAFADRTGHGSAPLPQIPIVPRPSARAHEDGPSRLEAVTVPPGHANVTAIEAERQHVV